jgi:hypothetical protein
MSTLANITSLNLSLQTGGAALAVKAAGRLVAPARTVFVYGTADDVAPNFTTVAGAITYANSLAPDPGNEPVVIRLFAKTDNTPYDLTGLSTWTTYANNGIYFVSDFVRLNETTTLPTTLPPGLQVWYIDPNGVETLWVGREDGTAWPSCGFTNYSARLKVTSASVMSIVSVKSNTIGDVTIGSPFGTAGFQLILPESYGGVTTGFCSVQSLALSAGASTRYLINGGFGAVGGFPNRPRATFQIRNTSFAESLPDTEIEFDVMIHFWPS